MVDLRPTIVPKSDQLNSDDLIGGPITVKVTKVLLSGVAEQPVSIHYEGDDGKPYKICKSMRRVLVHCWGPDGNLYNGRKMTLYRDPNVRFGGVAVGGIRISHLSDIKQPVTMALTESRASRKPFVVQPLNGHDRSAPAREEREPDDFPGDRPAPRAPEGAQRSTMDGLSLADRLAAFDRRLEEAKTTVKAKAIWSASSKLRTDLDASGDADELAAMEQRFNDRYAELEDAERGA